MNFLKGNIRGMVLIESLASLVFITLPFLFLQLEMIKRAQHEALLHYGAFVASRLRALGVSQQSVRQNTRKILKQSGPTNVSHMLRHLRFSDAIRLGSRARFSVQLSYRYPTWIRFPIPEGVKHHLEVQAQCHF